MAVQLGFDPKDGLYGGSESVYEAELGIPVPVLVALPEITFENPPKAEK